MKVWATLELSEGDMEPYIGNVYTSEALAYQNVDAVQKEYLKYSLIAPIALEITEFDVSTDSNTVWGLLQFKDSTRQYASIRGFYASEDLAEKVIMETIKENPQYESVINSIFSIDEFTIVEKLS